MQSTIQNSFRQASPSALDTLPLSERIKLFEGQLRLLELRRHYGLPVDNRSLVNWRLLRDSIERDVIEAGS